MSGEYYHACMGLRNFLRCKWGIWECKKPKVFTSYWMNGYAYIMMAFRLVKSLVALHQSGYRGLINGRLQMRQLTWNVRSSVCCCILKTTNEPSKGMSFLFSYRFIRSGSSIGINRNCRNVTNILGLRKNDPLIAPLGHLNTCECEIGGFAGSKWIFLRQFQQLMIKVLITPTQPVIHMYSKNAWDLTTVGSVKDKNARIKWWLLES